MGPKCVDALTTLNKKKLRLEDDTVMSADADSFPSLLLQNWVCYAVSKANGAQPDHCQEGLSNLTQKRSRSASPVMFFRQQKASANIVVWLTLANFFEGCNYKRIFLESNIHRCVSLTGKYLL